MNSMMLVVAMSAGQGPGGVSQPPYQYPGTPAQQVGTLPGVLPAAPPPPLGGHLGASIPMPMQQNQATPMTQPPMNGNGTDEEKKEEGKSEDKAEDTTPAPPIYLLGKTLRQTWLGQKMADDGYRLYGWTAMSYTLGSTSISNAPMYFNDRPNHFQLNQNWIHFEKSIDTSKRELQWGFVTDTILPGTDARGTLARGLFDGQLTKGPLSPNGAVPPAPVGTSVPYPIDLYQFYGQVFLPNLGPRGTAVKVGRFATHCEYEVVQAVDTPFVSRSYLFQYNPFTHTGVWTTSQLNDTWTVSNGLVVGSDNFINTTDRVNYVGQIKWAPPKGKNTVLLNTVITDPRYNVSQAFAQYNVYNLQYLHTFNDHLSYVLDTTFSHMYNVPGVGATTWYGAANYLIYKHTGKLTSTLRAEVFEDTDGVRTGFSGLYTEVTYGVAWAPRPGLIFRPSVRYDNNSKSTPFDGGVSSSMWTGAFEMIVRW